MKGSRGCSFTQQKIALTACSGLLIFKNGWGWSLEASHFSQKSKSSQTEHWYLTPTIGEASHPSQTKFLWTTFDSWGFCYSCTTGFSPFKYFSTYRAIWGSFSLICWSTQAFILSIRLSIIAPLFLWHPSILPSFLHHLGNSFWKASNPPFNNSANLLKCWGCCCYCWFWELENNFWFWISKFNFSYSSDSDCFFSTN